MTNPARKPKHIIGAILLLSILGPVGSSSEASAPRTETWVGHQVVFGQTDVPFMGTKQTRSDSYILAKVKRKGDAIEMEQTACKVTFDEVAGVKVSIPNQALLSLPSATIRFEPEGDVLKAKPWHVGWKEQDIDHDGVPGLSVEVNASICSGKLHVASATRSAAVATTTEDAIMGKIAVEVRQHILGSDNVCLTLFSKDTVEKQRGGFVYRRVEDGTTCASLLEKPWPILAKIKAPKPAI